MENQSGAVIRPLGRAPTYSGKCVARAIELYLNGVKPGYIRWDELQSTLEREFAEEFEVKGQDKPSPETVLSWVRKYHDAPERLKQLGVEQTTPNQVALGLGIACATQSQLSSFVSQVDTTGLNINWAIRWLMACLMMAVMTRSISATPTS